MRTPLVLLTLLAAATLLAACSPSPAQGDPGLPPGFLETGVPRADLSAYVYVSQGAPVVVTTSWFGDVAAIKNNPGLAALGSSVDVSSISVAVGPSLDYFGGAIALASEEQAEAAAQLAKGQALTQAWRSGKTMGFAYGNGDWPGTLKASLQAGDVTPFAEAYTDSWVLLRMLPKLPPDHPVAAGFAKVEGPVLEQAAGRMQLNLQGVTQALGSLNISQGAFIAYAQTSLDAPERVGPDYFRQEGISVLAAMRSSYPGWMLGFFLDSFAGQAGLEKGTQVAGEEVLTKDLGDAYLMAKPIGSVLFIAVATDKAQAETLMTAVLEQQG